MIKLTINKKDSIEMNRFLDESPDDKIWIPIKTEQDTSELYLLIENVKYTLEHGTRNEKGISLEKLMTFIYGRFSIAEVTADVRQGGNQIDHMLYFIDGMTPTFIHENVGLRLVGESKNHKDSISVREIADMTELLRSKNAKVGIFSSSKPFSNGSHMWTNAEGKRRKIALSEKKFIIGFTLDEIELLSKHNFYTMLKTKYYSIVDELKDDYLDVSDKVSFPEKLIIMINSLYSNNLLSDSAYDESLKKIEVKYGKTRLKT